ncbi:MAG: hypothetical protein JSS20_18860 [Proteobacteria bacterium]|nr:hypothetical protein [Pseudomonadota bacterium]
MAPASSIAKDNAPAETPPDAPVVPLQAQAAPRSRTRPFVRAAAVALLALGLGATDVPSLTPQIGTGMAVASLALG